MNNQLNGQNWFVLTDLKKILKSKDIILENNILKDEIYLEENKTQMCENIFESKELNENNENLFIDEENYFIKNNSSTNHCDDKNNCEEKASGENNLKNAKKKQIEEKIFLIEKIDKKKKIGEKRKKNIGQRQVIINLIKIILIEK